MFDRQAERAGIAAAGGRAEGVVGGFLFVQGLIITLLGTYLVDELILTGRAAPAKYKLGNPRLICQRAAEKST